MTTVMPSPSSPRAYFELTQPQWKGGGKVEEKEFLGAFRQAPSLYTTVHPVPAVNISKSSSPSASIIFGTEAEASATSPDGQPLTQRTLPPTETTRLDDRAENLPRLGLVPTSPWRHNHVSPTQSRRVRSRSNPQASKNSHRPQSSDDKVPHESRQTSILFQDKTNSFGSPVSQSQVSSPRPSTAISALHSSTKPPGRQLLTPTVPSGRIRNQSNSPQPSSCIDHPQETAQPARQSITNSKIPLEALNYCSPPSRDSFDFSSPAPQSQVTDTSRPTTIPNVFGLSLPLSTPDSQSTRPPVLNEQSKSKTEPLILRSRESRPRPMKMPHRHKSKDDTFLEQIASSVAAAAPPHFQARKEPNDSEPAPRTKTERFGQPFCPSTIDVSIRDAIMNRMNKEGHVYIFKSPAYFEKYFPNEPPLLKIGMAKDVSKRMENLKEKCGLSDLTRVADCQDRPMEFYWKVEELVHTELQNFRRLFKCQKCRNAKGTETEHQEWFAVDEEVALRTVQRWRRFIELEPYDENGILKDHWSRMIQPKNMEHPHAEEQWNDSQSRDIRWTTWIDKGVECENV